MRSTFLILSLFLILSTMPTLSEAGPIACLTLIGACVGPCLFAGPGFALCASLSCGISQATIAAACLAPVP